jgi:hypothetical protein
VDSFAGSDHGEKYGDAGVVTISHYALRGEELISEGAPHPSEVWWMRLHGAVLLAFLVTFGALLPRDIMEGWRHGMNRGSGLLISIIVTALTLTGYGLYYASGDTLRQWVSVVHWGIGLISIAALLWHILRGHRRSERMRRPPPLLQSA